jgi:hypothetical protein
MFLFVAALGLQAPPAPAASTAPAPNWSTREGDATLTNLAFRSGETLPRLRMHYATLGRARSARDVVGRVARHSLDRARQGEGNSYAVRL